MGANIGDTIRIIGNHSYRGHEGMVEQVEDIEGELYVHIALDGQGNNTLILRPNQYRVIEQAEEEHPPILEALGQKIVVALSKEELHLLCGIYDGGDIDDLFCSSFFPKDKENYPQDYFDPEITDDDEE